MKEKENELKIQVRELVKLYFEYNPNFNRGIAFKAKANDMITAYLTKHNKSYDELKHCIESNPMSNIPIWDLFYNHFFNKKVNEVKIKPTNYKTGIGDSTNVTDWI